MTVDTTTGGGAVPGPHKATRTVATILLGVGLVASSCSTDREITRPKPKPVTQALLTDALITIDDLPDTFTPAEPGTPVNAAIIDEHKCDDAMADLDPKLEATADFTGSGTRLTTTVAWFPGKGAAVEEVFRNVADDCSAVVVADKGLSLITKPLDFGVLSKDTLPVQFMLELSNGTIEERDLIIRREGDLFSVIRLIGPRPSDKVLLDQVVRLEIGRLAGVALDTS
jgi:hypothetical protein